MLFVYLPPKTIKFSITATAGYKDIRAWERRRVCRSKINSLSLDAT